MFRTYNPQSIVLAPRRLLPTGDCGFVVYADPQPPFVFNTAQSVRCQCRNFWPNPHTVDLCACGHHACYHSQEPTPPPTPSSPSTVLTIGAYASLMNRISRLEQEQDAQNDKKKKKHETSAHQPELEGMMNGLRSLDHKMAELVERMEEAEERLFGTERQGMEIDCRLNELELKSEELEEELGVLKDGFDEEDEEDEVRRAKEEENRMSELKQLESQPEIPTEPNEQPPSASKQIGTGLIEVVNQDDRSTTTTAVILAQPPFLKTFSLKRRLSDSDLLGDRQPHPTERSRVLTGGLSA